MSQIVIFGAGYHGRAVYRATKNNYKRIICWIDNDKKKSFKKLFGLPIYPVLHLKKLKYKKIIFCGRNIEEQINQYKKLKLDEKKIIVWDNIKLIPQKKLQDKREISAEKILKKIIFVLAKNKIFSWIDSSGILQVVRNKRISLLSDFDLSFYYKDHMKVIRCFKSNDLYKVVKKKIDNKKFKIFIIGRNNFKDFEPPIFDFHFKIIRKNFLYDAFNNKKKTPLKYSQNFIDYNFKKKLKFKFPNNYIDYLKFLYGEKSWKKRVLFYKNPLAKKNRPYLGPVDK